MTIAMPNSKKHGIFKIYQSNVLYYVIAWFKIQVSQEASERAIRTKNNIINVLTVC